MPIITALIILAATFITSFISGIFGMAGGMILMGVLVAMVAVPTAMITHGAIMMVANGWRAYLLKDAILWPVFWRYMIGATLGVALLFFIVWRPDKQQSILSSPLSRLLSGYQNAGSTSTSTNGDKPNSPASSFRP